MWREAPSPERLVHRSTKKAGGPQGSGITRTHEKIRVLGVIVSFYVCPPLGLTLLEGRAVLCLAKLTPGVHAQGSSPSRGRRKVGGLELKEHMNMRTT